ncbi:MAG: S8 family serine peptidase [Chloroflexi bacterium]|nr:S8 family serine peptidase [Chloroflexota bacterium]
MWKARAAARLSSRLLALVFIVTTLLAPVDLPLLAGKASGDDRVTAIVQLDEAPLARLIEGDQPPPGRPLLDWRTGVLREKPIRPRAKLDDPASKRYLQYLRGKQSRLERDVAAIAPEAVVRARFSTVLNGVAVTLPISKLSSLSRMPGVKAISLAQRFSPMLDQSVPLIAAPALWGRLGGPSNAGLGQKIAIIDTGIDQTHPFLWDPSLAFTSPTGFDPGDTNYTSNKVIVAKAYPPPGISFTPYAAQGHGTHVAGIAAGIDGYVTGGVTLSGVAPKAFLMSYNVFGPYYEADSAQIIQAIEDAVADGADVVNLSLGGPATSLADDPLVTAVRNAISAGVVFAIAAGNQGAVGTINSPGVTPEAITVGATTKADEMAYFSSRGPSVDLSIKPDLVAPGMSIYSSVPHGYFAFKNGTSMATPHVAGAAALLRQLHPDWTPAQVKSALVNTSVFTTTATLNNASVMDRGAGRIDLAAAASPGLTIDPPSTSFYFRAVQPDGFATTKEFRVAAEADGGGTWSLAVTQTATTSGLSASLSNSSLTIAPNGTGTISLALAASAGAMTGVYEGYVSLSNGAKSLRIPYWIRLVSYQLWLPRVSD